MRVLLVEDDPAQLRLMARHLMMAGIEVVTVETVEQAVAAAGPFDAIVSDFSLCGATARDIIAQRPGIPILVISGYDRPADWSFGRWLLKPALGEDIAAAVRQAVREAQR